MVSDTILLAHYIDTEKTKALRRKTAHFVPLSRLKIRLSMSNKAYLNGSKSYMSMLYGCPFRQTRTITRALDQQVRYSKLNNYRMSGSKSYILSI